MASQQGRGRLFAKIESWQEAVNVSVDCAVAFWVVAALYVVLATFTDYLILLDAAVYALLGYFLLAHYSRVAALFAVPLSFGSLGVTIWNRLAGDSTAGTNLFLAAIICCASLRSVQATFRVHSLAKRSGGNQPVPAAHHDAEPLKSPEQLRAEVEAWQGTPTGRRTRLFVILVTLGMFTAIGLILLPKTGSPPTGKSVKTKPLPSNR